MSLLDQAQLSGFKKLVNGDLSVENAVIIWTNFAGKPTKFVQNGGKRTFALVLTETVADELKNEGWNVKKREGREEGDDPLYFTEIAVNLEGRFPPKIMLLTEFHGVKSGNALNEHSIGQLDVIDIETVDMIIHPYEHNFSSVSKIKGYLKAIYITQAKDENFGGKYSDYETLKVNEEGSITEELYSATPEDDDVPF